jgi:hypothetical protein
VVVDVLVVGPVVVVLDVVWVLVVVSVLEVVPVELVVGELLVVPVDVVGLGFECEVLDFVVTGAPGAVVGGATAGAADVGVPRRW